MKRCLGSVAHTLIVLLVSCYTAALPTPNTIGTRCPLPGELRLITYGSHSGWNIVAKVAPDFLYSFPLAHNGKCAVTIPSAQHLTNPAQVG
jgi:hypothetical protein